MFTGQFVFTFFCLTGFCEAYKILVVFPFPSKSHGILGDGYVRNLLEEGHEVTYITAFPKNSTNKMLHEIVVSSNYFPDIFDINAVLNKDVDLNHPFNISIIIRGILESTFKNKNVRDLINDSNQEFDVVIAEWLFNELNCGFSAVFDCPFIWASSLEPHSLILKLIDQPTNPSYTPGALSTIIPPFTFLQRVQELWIQIFINLYGLYAQPIENIIYKTWLGPAIIKRGRTVPPYEELKYKASLVLGNSHYSLGQATRLPQSYKAIGGYHIDPKLTSLSPKLKEIIEGSIHGVIYFSMGSNLQSKDFPKVLQSALLKVFSSLNQTVIWKFEEELTNLPHNVHIFKWVPQQSILSHSNCVAFITHGGLLSTIEAVHYGVPLIGIPIYADQFINIARAVNKGYAKKIELSYNLAEDLKNAIGEIISNPLYATKAKELSYIYHHRPVPPGQELVHWVEHVIATKGATHLRSPALMVPWYQKIYLDAVTILLVILYCLKILVGKLILLCKKSIKRKKE